MARDLNIQKTIIAHYTPSDEKFLDWSLIQLNEYYKPKNLKPLNLLEATTTMLSRIKTKLINQYRNTNYETSLDTLWNEFDNDADRKSIDEFALLGPRQQRNLQLRYKTSKDELEQALATLPLIPDNLQSYKLPEQQKDERVELRKARENLKADAKKIVWTNEQMHRILHGITSNEVNIYVPALLLATGRRSIEIRSSGTFEPADDIWHAVFSGQAKSATPEKKNTIPLLVPYYAMIAAFNKLRSLDTVPQHYEKFSPTIKPHLFRSLYASAAEQIFNKDVSTRPGFRRRILGHEVTATSVKYDLAEVEPTLFKVPLIAELKDIVYVGKPQEGRAKELVEFMKLGLTATNYALRKRFNGGQKIWESILNNNAALIKRYNESL